MMALLFVLYVGDIEPRQETPEPIPYEECVEMAGRLVRWFDHTMSFNFPTVTCEVTP